MSVGSAILANLAAALGTVSSVKTVVSGNEAPDLSAYAVANLPLVAVWLGPLVPQYETGRHALWVQEIYLSLFYVGNENEITERESVKKAVIDKLGADPTLQLVCENLDLLRIEQRGVFPLYEIAFVLRTEYEQSISNV